MAGTSSLTLEKSILWKSRLQPKPNAAYTTSTSPGFLVQDFEWHLEQWLIPCRLNNSTYCYVVSLSRTNGETRDKLENNFEVSTFIQKGDRILLPSDETQISHIERGYHVTAQFYERDIEKNLPDVRYDDDVFIVYRFHLPASDVSLQKEKLEVTTQTNFDRSLVKNLHDVKLSSDVNLDSLSRDLCKLLEDKTIPDINLRCGNRTVAAHKAILAARSRVFAAMFQSKMLESETGVVDITDADATIFEIFLKYVYSGRLYDLSDEDLPSLYAAGDKYDVRALKRECSEWMINRLSRENCLDTLLLADAHTDKDFKNVVLDFILKQAEILKSEKWMKFRKENPSLSNEVYDFVLQRKCF